MAAAEHNSFCSRWRCQTLRECSFVRLLVLLSLALFLSHSLSLSPCRMLEETRGHARTHPTCLFAFGSVQKSHRIQLSCTLSAALTRIFISSVSSLSLARFRSIVSAVMMTATCPLADAAQYFVKVCPLRSFQAHSHLLYGWWLRNRWTHNLNMHTFPKEDSTPPPNF